MRLRRTLHRECDHPPITVTLPIRGSLKKSEWGAEWSNVKLKPKQTIKDYFVGLEDPLPYSL